MIDFVRNIAAPLLAVLFGWLEMIVMLLEVFGRGLCIVALVSEQQSILLSLNITLVSSLSLPFYERPLTFREEIVMRF